MKAINSLDDIFPGVKSLDNIFPGEKSFKDLNNDDLGNLLIASGATMFLGSALAVTGAGLALNNIICGCSCAIIPYVMLLAVGLLIMSFVADLSANVAGDLNYLTSTHRNGFIYLSLGLEKPIGFVEGLGLREEIIAAFKS